MSNDGSPSTFAQALDKNDLFKTSLSRSELCKSINQGQKTKVWFVPSLYSVVHIDSALKSNIKDELSKSQSSFFSLIIQWEIVCFMAF